MFSKFLNDILFLLVELAGGDGEKKDGANGNGAGGGDEEDPEVKKTYPFDRKHTYIYTCFSRLLIMNVPVIMS